MESSEAAATASPNTTGGNLIIIVQIDGEVTSASACISRSLPADMRKRVTIGPVIKSTVGLSPLQGDFMPLSEYFPTTVLYVPVREHYERKGNVIIRASLRIDRKWEIYSCEMGVEKNSSRYDGKEKA